MFICRINLFIHVISGNKRGDPKNNIPNGALSLCQYNPSYLKTGGPGDGLPILVKEEMGDLTIVLPVCAVFVRESWGVGKRVNLHSVGSPFYRATGLPALTFKTPLLPLTALKY